MIKHVTIMSTLALLLQACSGGDNQKTCRGLSSDAEAIACLLKLPRRNVLEDKEFADYLTKHGVYVSVTTTPVRLSRLPQVFETLDLSLVKKVFLVLPKEFANKKGATYPAVPEALLKLPKIEVLTPNEDYGTATKILPALEKLKIEDPESILITIDDDVGYAPGMLGELALRSFKENIAVAGGGQSAEFFGLDRDINWMFPERDSVDILEGVSGVAYQTKFFSEDDIEKMKTWVRRSNDCRFSDDFMLSHVLEQHAIRKIIIKNEYMPEYVPFTYGFQDDARHLGANGEYLNPIKYRACGLEIYK
ncbi:MAG: hypothetical protein WCK42_02280 [Myxococcaceae bacterium]